MPPAESALRPRSLVEILDLSLTLYRDHFLHFLALSAVCQLPLGLLSVLLTGLVYNGVSPSYSEVLGAGPSLDLAQVLGALVGATALSILSLVVLSFGIAAGLHSVRERLGGSTPGVREAYREAVRVAPRFLATRLLCLLGVLIAFVPALVLLGVGLALLTQGGGSLGVAGGLLITLASLLAVVGAGFALYFWVRWRFYGQASVLEGRGPVDSLRRAQELAAGRWWRLLAGVLLLELFIGALSLSPSAVAQLPLLLIYGAEYS
ncbi:MAG: hypothetical protein M3281_09715, partial [Chloroflexota bacterium]|nr:hypothetical protein [Chloroflexota bacterium]